MTWRGNDFNVESVVNVGDDDGVVDDEDIILGGWTAGAQDVGTGVNGTTAVLRAIGWALTADVVVGTGVLFGMFWGTLDAPVPPVVGVIEVEVGGMSYFWTCRIYCSAVGTPCQQTSKLFVEARTSCTLPVGAGFSTSKNHKSLQHT